jgi:hypothetical protein
VWATLHAQRRGRVELCSANFVVVYRRGKGCEGIPRPEPLVNGARYMTRICNHPGCEATFPVFYRRGQPPLYCPEHRSTKYAMIRQRHHPELKAGRIPQYPCCQEAGKKCPQHRSIPKHHMAYRPSKAERLVIGELIDVFGHVSIFNGRGHLLNRIEAE